jgi:hypothetical protein
MENLTPQQQLFLAGYLDPNSDTWSNAKQSAIKAGYSLEYADNIMSLMPDWLSDNIGNTNLVKKALDNLESLLDEEDKRIKADMTKFTLERLSKGRFSARTELTGPSGKALSIQHEDKTPIEEAFKGI